jgi:hypothetical protein
MPVGLIGLLLLAYGVSALIIGDHSFAERVPSAGVHGKIWIGLEVNGWSGLLFVAGGLLLIGGAMRRWGAKTMALIVGLVLGAAAVIGLVKGDGVVGLFAANNVTEVVWGAAAALLIGVSMTPRVSARALHEFDPGISARQRAAERAGYESPAGGGRHSGAPQSGAANAGSPAGDTQPSSAPAEAHG